MGEVLRPVRGAFIDFVRIFGFSVSQNMGHNRIIGVVRNFDLAWDMAG